MRRTFSPYKNSSPPVKESRPAFVIVYLLAAISGLIVGILLGVFIGWVVWA